MIIVFGFFLLYLSCTESWQTFGWNEGYTEMELQDYFLLLGFENANLVITLNKRIEFGCFDHYLSIEFN